MTTNTTTEAPVLFNGQPLTTAIAVTLWAEFEPVCSWENTDGFCYVCGRCTDHVAEHDDLVDAGLAAYDGFRVVLTEAGQQARIEGRL